MILWVIMRGESHVYLPSEDCIWASAMIRQQKVDSFHKEHAIVPCVDGLCMLGSGDCGYKSPGQQLSKMFIVDPLTCKAKEGRHSYLMFKRYPVVSLYPLSHKRIPFNILFPSTQHFWRCLCVFVLLHCKMSKTPNYEMLQIHTSQLKSQKVNNPEQGNPLMEAKCCWPFHRGVP